MDVPEEIRITNVGIHLLIDLPTYRICRMCSKKQHEKRTEVQCKTCTVPLCAVWFITTFPTKWKKIEDAGYVVSYNAKKL